MADKWDEFIEEFIDYKANMLAMKAYVGSTRYINEDVICKILDIEVPKEDEK